MIQVMIEIGLHLLLLQPYAKNTKLVIVVQLCKHRWHKKTYHYEAVANPKSCPPLWAVWVCFTLAVDSNNISWGFTDNTPGDVRPNCRFLNWHHWNWSICTQPIRSIISASIVADIVEVAEEERHCRESPDARSCKSKILMMCLLISFNIKKRVSVPKFNVSRNTLWNLFTLAMPY